MTRDEREFNGGIRAFNKGEEAPADKKSPKYAGWVAGHKMAALREKELKKMQARVVKQAAKEVKQAISFINKECPEQLELFRQELEKCFADQPQIEEAPEPQVEEVPTEPEFDVLAVKERFRSEFNLDRPVKEVSAKVARDVLAQHAPELLPEPALKGREFWVELDRKMKALVPV